MSEDNDTLDNEGSGGDYLSELVGEGRKFKTAEDLAKGKVEADSFIERLKGENEALRALISNHEDTKRSTEVMSELLERISKATPERNKAGETPPARTDSNQPAVTSKDMENVYKAMRKQEQEAENQTRSMSRIRDKYKEKTEEFLKSKSDELGLDMETLVATAKRSPAAFWNLLGENNTSNFTGTPGSPKGANTAAMFGDNPQHGAIRDQKYYDKLKEEMGATKFIMDRKLQVQLHKDMQTLGDRWKGE